MNTNQVMTGGAIAFAVFAVYVVMQKQGGGAMSSQPGQQARDAGLQAWNDIQAKQYEDLALQTNQDAFSRMEHST